MAASPVEIWLPIRGYEGRYEISNLGRVRAIFRSPGFPEPPRILKPIIHEHPPYPRINLYDHNSKRYTGTIHKLVMTTFVGPCPVGYVIRHLDGNAHNCALENLCYGTSAENEADKKIHGTVDRPHGERNSQAKLTDIQALAIRLDPRKAREIAEVYGVSETTILAIKRGKRYRETESRRRIRAEKYGKGAR